MLVGPGQAAGGACSSAERALRVDVLAGGITLSVRLWKRPQVREGGRYGGR